jgi:simple sugar transport system substrate-binding protein
VEVVQVDPDPVKAGKTIADKLAGDNAVDVILALSANYAGEPAVAAVKALTGRKVRVGTFDITDAMLNAVADGDAAFAIDQQPYLQGYLPVELLATLKRRGVIPVSNISTGPRLVTMEEAKKRLGRSAAGSGAEPAPANGG